jgi:peptidoglycan/LPS O-acetylase OafA/YrhL
MEQPRGAGFDLIRVAAAMGVFSYHARGVGIVILGPVANHGNIGVPVFFALSGYLVYRPFLYRPVEPASYLLRRALRMAPAWLVAIFGVRLFMQGQAGLLALVMWSLLVELLYYAVLPWLARLAAGRELPVTAGLGVTSYILSLAVPGTHIPMLDASVLFALFFWCFALGMLLAVTERDRPGLIRGRWWLAAGLPLIVVGVARADTDLAFYANPGASLLVVVGVIGVMGGLMKSRQHWAWAALAADSTYSFYLWHLPILAALAVLATPPAAVALAFLITAGISVATTIVLERPIRTRANAWIGDRARRRTIAEGVRALVRARVVPA